MTATDPAPALDFATPGIARSDGGHRAPGVSVTVVIPCLNEAQSIAQCVREAIEAMAAAGLDGDVVVVDNASRDGSGSLAESAGARVVHESRRGYGSAYLAGFAQARGPYIVMADADLTYDFREIPRFVEALEAGADVVIGDRMDNIHAGAMPWLHRYVGNPILTGLLNLIFRTGVADAHCGMRAVRRDRLEVLDLRTTGMEFASEMVIRASKLGLDIRQFPIEYHPREGESTLSSFRDGWRHLRFLLVHSPTHLFLAPGILLLVLGALLLALGLSGVELFGREWELHSMIVGAVLAAVGTQILSLGVCAETYGAYFMGDGDKWVERVRRRMRLEHGLLLGGGLLLSGLALFAVLLVNWAQDDFGALAYERMTVVAGSLVIVGTQVFFTSFLVSILGLRRRG